MKLLKIFFTIIFLLISAILLVLTIKGDGQDPYKYQTSRDTRVGGPFEASNTTARYALTVAIVEAKTFFLDEGLAKFASPDVVDYKGKFMSIFTPGISLLAVPFYMIGKQFGLPQIGAFSVNIVFALLNIVLVAQVARKFGASFFASLVSGFLFIFATNALVYTHSLAQHQVSTAIILLCLLNAMRKRTLINDLWFGALAGLSLLVDMPNPFLLIPIGVYILWKHVDVEEEGKRLKISIKTTLITIVIGLIPLLGIFAWYNKATTGSPTLMGQSIGRSKVFQVGAAPSRQVSAPENPTEVKSPTKSKLPFNTRKQLSGLYTLMVSDERSWIFYSPIVFIGLIGLVLVYRKKETQTWAVLAIGVIIFDIVMYSMFGDPWGGWAFGPRYLIPAAALLCVGIGVALERFNKNVLFMVFFFILSFYSVGVNALGAVTTSMIPPKVEAVSLPQPIPYTYQYNLKLLDTNFSSSLIYTQFLSKNMTPISYLLAYCGASVVVLFILTLLLAVRDKSKKV